MIQEYRIKKGYTQSDIANILDISFRQYQRIDTEKCLPRKDILLKLFSILQIPVDVQKDYIYRMILKR